jgi:AcrR family transcriptional regulator
VNFPGEVDFVSQDPRRQRTRQALTDAVLELAAASPVHRISVNELTKKAGVDRTTFYNHAATPEALLQVILTAEIEAAYQGFRRDLEQSSLSAFALQEQGFRKVLQHIVDRQSIYRLSLHNGDGNLVQAVIGSQFAEAAREMLDENLYLFDPPVELSEFDKMFAARSVAGAMVGGITAWLIYDGELDIDRFIDSFHLFFPDWFTMASAK